MRRRTFLAALPAALRGQPAIDVLAEMASALSAGNPEAFVRLLDPSMEHYARLEAGVTALARQNELTSSVEIVAEEGDDKTRRVEADWQLDIRGASGFERRRQVVTCRLARTSKGWRVTALEPVEFFTPRLRGTR